MYSIFIKGLCIEVILSMNCCHWYAVHHPDLFLWIFLPTLEESSKQTMQSFDNFSGESWKSKKLKVNPN